MLTVHAVQGNCRCLAIANLSGAKHLIVMLEHEGDFYKKLAPSAATSASALGVLSLATSLMRILGKDAKESLILSLINAQIG